MQNKWFTYSGITLILLLIAYIGFAKLDYQRLLERSKQETAKHQETEQLLRSKEKQVDFYFEQLNELILANQELEMMKVNGGEGMKLDDRFVWESLNSKEYMDIMAKYEAHYGILDKLFIPKNETLGGLRYKVEESIVEGYDLIPRYYGITHALMCIHTKEFRDLNRTFEEHFGDVIPTEQIYGTMEELIDIVNKSVKEGRNLLPEYYGY